MLTSLPSFRAGGWQFYDDKRPFIDWVVDLLDGEHFSRERNVREYDGSSPQAWGTQACASRAPGTLRFIPTGVGNTDFGATATTQIPVHPHRRGEHPSPRHALPRHTGSSPQAWGTRTESRP